jgi:hypothetical protein
MDEQNGEPVDWTDADDQQETLEDLITHLDGPMGADGPTTAAEQRRGESLEEALAREAKPSDDDELGGAKRFEVLSEVDAPDDEPQLLGGETAQVDGWLAAEEAAMQVVEDAPGATSDASDGYVDE